MAQRDSKKAKRSAAPRKATTSAGLSEAVQRLEARARVLESERDGLKAELELARAMITRLEERHGQVVTRIDWVIDSLRSAIENEH